MRRARLEGLLDWLGLERNVLVVFVTILILGMGEELWIRFIPKYLEVLGAGAAVIAAYGTLTDLLDAVYQYPGGWLADHLGRQKSLILFTGLAIVGYGLYLLAPSWPWILAGTFFVMAWSSLTLPAVFAVIGDHLPAHRRSMGFGIQSFLKRVPIVLAPPVGGWLIARLGFPHGMQVGLAITIGLALAAIALIRRHYVERMPATPDLSGFISILKGMDTHLKRLLVADCLARFADGIVDVFVVLYVINVLRTSPAHFGWLVSLQMMVAILSYLPSAKLAERFNRKPFVLLTFSFFALFPLALVSAHSAMALAIAFAIAGLREIGEPARKSLIVDLAREATRARSVGVYYLIRGLVVFPASLVGGWLWTINHQAPFHVAFALGVTGFLAYALLG
jgi:MFS family permease